MFRGGELCSYEAVAWAGPGAGGLSTCIPGRKAHPKGRSFCGGDPQLAFLWQPRAVSPDSNPCGELEETVNLPAGSVRLLARSWPTRSTVDLGWLAGLFAAGILLTEVG